MKCQRCTADVPAQSRFCLRCGSPIEIPTPPPSAQPSGVFSPLATKRPNNKPLIFTIAALALALVGLGAYVVHGQLTQQAGNNANGKLVQASGNNSNSALVQAPGNNAPGAPVQAVGEVAPPPPVQAVGDVIDVSAIDDYLKFVKQVEASKQQLLHDEDRDVKVMIDTIPVKLLKEAMRGTDDQGVSGDPNVKNITADITSKKISDIEGNWNQLSSLFRQRTPPQACIELRDKYLSHLGRVQARIVKVYTLMSKINSDPQSALSDLRGMEKSNSDLDSDGKSADSSLGEICSKYKLAKQFDIKGDESGGGDGALTGMAGILGQ